MNKGTEVDHKCDSGNFDRTICPEPCGTMHYYCDTCGKRQDHCAHDEPRVLAAEWRAGEGADPFEVALTCHSWGAACECNPTPGLSTLADGTIERTLRHHFPEWTERVSDLRDEVGR